MTVPLSAELPTYPGRPPFRVDVTHRIADGQPYNVARIALGTHTGTHVDAPYHFLADGRHRGRAAPGDPARQGPRGGAARPRPVERADLEALDLRDDLRVLLKTRMSGQLRQQAFQEDFVYLTEDAATYLVQVGIKLVGIDYLSVEKFGSSDYPAHHALLEAGVVIVEGLDLSEVEPGEYDMICLPLRIAGADGSPARVILRPRSPSCTRRRGDACRMNVLLLRDVVAVLLAGGAGERLFPLTRDRAKPAVPFGGPYRIIDFTLSNCINSGLRKIFIATQYKAQSLNRHVRMGWSVVNPRARASSWRCCPRRSAWASTGTWAPRTPSTRTSTRSSASSRAG